MNSGIPSSRSPCYVKEFARWFRKNKNRFLIPLELKRISSKKWVLIFVNTPKELQISMSDGELSVWVKWEGEFVDCLQSFEAYPVRGCEGTIECKLCSPHTTYPNIRALLETHLYEPFLRWVNEVLYPAKQLAVYQMDGCTWARLTRPETTQSATPYLQATVDSNNGSCVALRDILKT